MTKRTKIGTRISTTALIAATMLAIGFGATALNAGWFGEVMEEEGCMRYGGRVLEDGFQRPSRLVCTAVVKGPAKRLIRIRYEETSSLPDGFDAGQDKVISFQPAGRTN